MSKASATDHLICSVASLSGDRHVVFCLRSATSDWHVYIAPVIALVSATIALRALYNARMIARQKATIDLVEKTESTAHYREINAAFSRVRRSPGGFDAFVGADQEGEQRRQINDYLNHYELIALGISHGVLDGRFYQAWMGSTFVRDWNAAAPWIQRERWRQEEDGGWTYHPAVFANYERVACRWSREARRLASEPQVLPTSRNGGPGDDPLPRLDTSA